MITTSEISMFYGARKLFEDVTISFLEGQRVGLTGPNGAGKSTLFKIIKGEVEPTTGIVSLPEKVGFLRQNIEDYANFSVTDVVIMGNQKLWDTLQKRDALYEVEFTDEIGIQLGELEEVIADEDGYTAESDAEMLLEGMGIPNEFYPLKMKEIPTDFQFKVLLCQALFGHPQALLLDEPTNHLDLESISWLESFLLDYTGALLVISHDRHFLNTVCTNIADLDYETVIMYPGNYDSMVLMKTQSRNQELTEAKAKEKKIAQLKDFVAKFGAGSRASQVQSRVREIDRLQPQDLKKSNIERPYIRFIPTEKQPGKMILKVENLSKAYGENQVLKNLSFEVARGDKLGIIGNNGRGKTTLMHLLAGIEKSDSGTIEWGHATQCQYFPQNHNDVVDKSRDATAFEWLREIKKDAYDQEIRSAMGKMLFGGDDAFKKIAALSGGETARLILARMMLVEQNVVLLDEPNNHLDLEAVSALSWGLEEYKGTAIVVSHDRDLISHVATKILAFEEDGVRYFSGNFEEFFQFKEKTAK